VKETAARFCAAHGERSRGFGEDALRVLTEYPWPGNLRELDSVVVQSLAASASDPLEPSDLEQGGEAFAPLDAEALGAVLLESDQPEPEPETAPAPERPPAPARPAPPEAAAPAVETVSPRTPGDAGLRPLAAALAHELRSPLTGIRTFSELLAERWSDAEFRARFAERTAEDVQRIEESLDRLSRVASFGPPVVETVDVTALLGELLEARRERVRERRLLVLQELDTERPEARGDPEQVRFALDALLGACFALVPERGDLYLASKHHPTGLRGGPSLRVLVRFHGPQRGAPAGRVPGLSPAENSLALVLAELVVHAQQGSFTLDQGQGDETLVVLELPAI
jgi:signal transduction histidine kinase